MILDVTNPSALQLEQWAYDNDILLIDQDEDLILQDEMYVPALLKFASDVHCPKNDYCLAILTDFCQTFLKYRKEDVVNAIRKHLDESQIGLSEEVEAWKSKFILLHDLMIHPKEISIDQAVDIAYTLLVGEYCRRQFERIKTLDSGFIVFHTYTQSYSEYLFIDPKNSIWLSSRAHSDTELLLKVGRFL